MELIAFLENVTGGVRCAFLPVGVPVPETMAVFVTFYGRVETEGREYVGPMPLLPTQHPITLRLMPRY